VNSRLPLDFPSLYDRRYPVHQVADGLAPYLRAIVERFQPEKIILFGSYAYGVPTPHSDIDILVIRNGISSAKTSNLEIRNALAEVPAPPLSFTLLSRTPTEVEAKLTEGSPIFRDILGKGVVLYAAQANE